MVLQPAPPRIVATGRELVGPVFPNHDGIGEQQHPAARFACLEKAVEGDDRVRARLPGRADGDTHKQREGQASGKHYYFSSR